MIDTEVTISFEIIRRRQVMPNRNRTGPEGQGPLTGWGLGSCNGQSAVDDKKDKSLRFGQGRGRGFGLGRRFGRGFGHNYGQRVGRRFISGFEGGYSTQMTLEEREKYLEEELSAVKEQMNQQKPER